MPEISVVIPTLNEGENFRKTLESLRKQTFDDFETIVVDGNSSDNTRDVTKEYTNRVFVLKKRGVPLARNYGAKKGKGKILAMTDADCILPSSWLEKIYNDIYEKNVEMVWGPVYYGKGCPLLGRINLLMLWEIQKHIWNFVPYTFNPNLAFTKKGFNKIGGYRIEICNMDDYDIGMRGIRNLRSYFNPKNKVFFSHRRINGNTTVLRNGVTWTKNFIEYHTTGSVSEEFVPMNNG